MHGPYDFADFRVLRERVGVSKAWIAKQLDIRERSVNAFENDYGRTIFPDAWDLLDLLAEQQRQTVRNAVDQIEREAGEHGGDPQEVVLTYYRSQDEFNQFNEVSAPVGMVMANTRLIAIRLEDNLYNVQWVYPDDENSFHADERHTVNQIF